MSVALGTIHNPLYCAKETDFLFDAVVFMADVLLVYEYIDAALREYDVALIESRLCIAIMNKIILCTPSNRDAGLLASKRVGCLARLRLGLLLLCDLKTIILRTISIF